ncbi:MAG: glycosyltransferase family 2 protein [Ruminococcus sp.]|nr:glycosyltransferase family 2 protein [Ruminococcus sp.]
MADINALVSIIVPAYNCEDYIYECVDNILNQSYSNLQIIIVDDGSSDKTYDKCKDFNDERITLLHKENGGASSARNYGLKYAKGDYIMFADSDDYLDKDAVDILVNLIQKEQADLIYFEADNFTDDKTIEIKEKGFSQKVDYPVMSGNELIPLLIKNKDYHAAPFLFFINNKLFESGICFEEGIMLEDELFSFQLFRASNKVYCLRKELYHRRVRQGSVMTSKGKEVFRFVSILTVFNALLNERHEPYSDKTLELYLSRIGMLLVGYWDALSPDQKKEMNNNYKPALSIIRNSKGFGNKELLVRTYGFVPWALYVAPNRIIKKIKNRIGVK